MINIKEMGAVADGSTDNTEAIQKALDRCGEAGGGTVLIPPGHFITRALHLRSHVELHLAHGSLLQGSTDIENWPLFDDRFAGGQSENTNAPDEGTVYAPLLYGDDLEDVSITGTGRLDGNGQVWWDLLKNDRCMYRRPRLIAPNNCKGLRIEGIFCSNPGQWTINPVCCENVIIHSVTINNPSNSPNTDGINPDSCRYVRISDCHLDVGDDCITLKSGTEGSPRPMDQPCENITITNCTMVNGHGAVVCGSEMSRNVRNVTITNCIFQGTDRGLRFKSRRGRGGRIENVRASNIVMEGVAAPFVFNLFYVCGVKDAESVSDTSPWPLSESTPSMSNLAFSHITVRYAHWAGIFAHGLPERYLRDLSFEDVQIAFAADATEGQPAMAGHGSNMSKVGLFARFVDGLHCRNVTFDGYEGEIHRVDDCSRVALK